MNKLVLLAVAAVALVGFTSYLMISKPQLTAYPEEIVRKFKEFSAKYHKFTSGTDPDLVAYRLGVFYSNYKMINEHNAQQSSYKLGENQFMDLTKAEFKKLYLGYNPSSSTVATSDEIVASIKGTPKSDVNWVTKGDVTGVKDQGQCGSCWAFSTTGSVESAYAIHSGKLVSLSEQQLVDCSGSFGNQGCNGGLMDNAFQYIEQFGLESEQDYPYDPTSSACHYDASKVVTKITSYNDVPQTNCDTLQTAASTQPISIAVDAEEWQFYSSGILDNCSTQLDHGVLLVGFSLSSSSQNDQYWLVKNSWGASWGESGFIRLAAGNTCGLCNAASYPII